jgi:uncharacterized membrane protein YwaF
MRSTILRLVLVIAGAVLLIVGIAHLAPAFLDGFYPFGSANPGGFSLVLEFPLYWVAVAIVGAMVCFLSYWLFRKRA